jgi:hypothetical protein
MLEMVSQNAAAFSGAVPSVLALFDLMFLRFNFIFNLCSNRATIY